MTHRPTVLQRLRYQFDNRLAKGLGPMIGLLALVTAAVVVIAGLLLWLGDVDLNGQQSKGIEGVWASLLRTLDPGTMGSDRGWWFRLISLAVTVAGIFIVSTLIGILANGISQRIDQLRRGRSEVIEAGHTLLLGWSHKAFLIIREIGAAAGPTEQPCVVVLAERDMVEMEEQFRRAFSDVSRVRLVSRSGNPSSPQDLERVAPQQARSVVVLKDEEKGDAATVRTVLALEHLGLDRSIPVVIELEEVHRARALAAASSLNVVPVVSNDWIATVTARAVYAPALASIYEDLLNFEGAEVQFTGVPSALVGRSIHQAFEAVTGGAPFGLRREGVLTLAPPSTLRLVPGDELVLVTDQRGAIGFDGEGGTSEIENQVESVGHIAILEQLPTHLLILGWSDLGCRVLDLLDQCLPPGSLIDVVAPPDAGASLPSQPFQRFTLRHSTGSATDTRTLSRAFASGTVSRVLVLSGPHSSNPQHRDADALLTVLELRHLLGAHPDVQVTVEISDPGTIDLVRRDAHEEFIVGERLVCLVMSQVSQTPGVMDVLRSLLAEDDTDLALLPADAVLAGRSSVNGAEAASALHRHGHYLIGAGHRRALQLHPRLRDLSITSGMDLLTVRCATAVHPQSPDDPL